MHDSDSGSSVKLSNSLSKSVARGMTWTGMSKFFNQGIRLIAMIILARLLFPEDFGIAAMAFIITTAVYSFFDMGLNLALIQRKDITNSHLSTVFWIILFSGILLCIITVAISSLVADFFNNELVGPVLAVYSVTFIISSLGSVHGAVLRKNLEFHKLSITEVAGDIVYLTITIVLAVNGFGVWSIVVGGLANDFTYVILRWFLCRWHPSFIFSIDSLKDLWKFGLNITGVNVVNLLIQRLDYLIIGRFLNATALGFYNLGLRITRLPSEGLLLTITRVAFPTFAIIQNEEERLRVGFLKSVAAISVIGLPIFIGLALVGTELIPVVFGEKWLPAILPMQILCIMGAFELIGLACSPLINSYGRPDITLRLALLKVALLIPSLLIGVRYEAAGVASGLLIVTVILLPIQQIITNRLIGLKMKNYVLAIYPAFLGSLVMAVVLIAFRYGVINVFNLPNSLILFISVSLGIIVYYLTLRINKSAALDEIINLASDMVSPYIKSVMSKIGLLRKDTSHMDKQEIRSEGEITNA